MSVDYDLIVLGGAPVGRYAALRAHRYGARVALIEPPNLPNAELALNLLSEINRTIPRQDWLKRWNPENPPQQVQFDQADQFNLDWVKAVGWIRTFAETLEISTATTALSLTRLISTGVDVIVDQLGTNDGFCQRFKFGFVIGERLLRSRAYLLAPSTVPEIAGLAAIDCATCANWFEQWAHNQSLPRRLLILGLDPRGLVLAQALNRLGTQVTLLTSHNRLLPNPTLATLLQAQLEAEGVTVLTRAQVSQVTRPSQCNAIQVQLTTQTTSTADQRESGVQVETEVILLATTQRLALDAFNLEQTGLNWQPGLSVNIAVNTQLQTAQSRIYACTATGTEQAHRQADVALHNALFWPPKAFTARGIPELLPTDPPLSWVGLNEQQAQQHYGPAVQSGRVKAVQWRDTDWFELIAHRDGRLLGAQGIGIAACESVRLVGIAIQQNLKLKALVQMPDTELIQQAAIQFQRSAWQQELLETWFNLRRSR
jgi:pyruvate/2-oxoglutarate dehydrogenase complex dihydrolipoamide dehydrogenase (E3) component